MTDDPTGVALLASVIADPEDDTARVIFADWLEENGQEQRAQFIRLSVERATLEPRPAVIASSGDLERRAPGTTTEHAAYLNGVRISDVSELKHPNVLVDVQGGGYTFLGCAVVKLNKVGQDWSVDFLVTGERCPVRVRCEELETQAEAIPAGIRFGFPAGKLVMPAGFWVGKFVRGFRESITCTADEWLGMADALTWNPVQDRPCPLTAHPLKTVTITDYLENSVSKVAKQRAWRSKKTPAQRLGGIVWDIWLEEWPWLTFDFRAYVQTTSRDTYPPEWENRPTTGMRGRHTPVGQAIESESRRIIRRMAEDYRPPETGFHGVGPT